MDFAARHKTLAAAWDACERPDWMIWLARKKGWLTKEQSVRISIGAAEAVIGIYAAKYPTDGSDWVNASITLTDLVIT